MIVECFQEYEMFFRLSRLIEFRLADCFYRSSITLFWVSSPGASSLTIQFMASYDSTLRMLTQSWLTRTRAEKPVKLLLLISIPLAPVYLGLSKIRFGSLPSAINLRSYIQVVMFHKKFLKLQIVFDHKFALSMPHLLGRSQICLVYAASSRSRDQFDTVSTICTEKHEITFTSESTDMPERSEHEKVEEIMATRMKGLLRSRVERKSTSFYFASTYI